MLPRMIARLADRIDILKIDRQSQAQTAMKPVEMKKINLEELTGIYQGMIDKSDNTELQSLFVQIKSSPSKKAFDYLYRQTKESVENELQELLNSLNPPINGEQLQFIFTTIVQKIMSLLLFKTNSKELESFAELLAFITRNENGSVSVTAGLAYIPLLHLVFSSSALDVNVAKLISELLFKLLQLEFKIDEDVYLLQDYLLLAWDEQGEETKIYHPNIFQPPGHKPLSLAIIDLTSPVVPLRCSDVIGSKNPTDWAKFYQNNRILSSKSSEDIIVAIVALDTAILNYRNNNREPQYASYADSKTVNDWAKQLIDHLIDLLSGRNDLASLDMFEFIKELYIPAPVEREGYFSSHTAQAILALIYHVYHNRVLFYEEKTVILDVLRHLVDMNVVDRQANPNNKLKLREVMTSLQSRGTLWISILDGRVFNNVSDPHFFNTPGSTLNLLSKQPPSALCPAPQSTDLMAKMELDLTSEPESKPSLASAPEPEVLPSQPSAETELSDVVIITHSETDSLPADENPRTQNSTPNTDAPGSYFSFNSVFTIVNNLSAIYTAVSFDGDRTAAAIRCTIQNGSDDPELFSRVAPAVDPSPLGKNPS